MSGHRHHFHHLLHKGITVMVKLGCLPSVCSLNLTPSVLTVSPVYYFHHHYITVHTVSLSGACPYGLTNRDLRVLTGLWYKRTPWDLNTLWSCSDTPEMMGMLTGNFLAVVLSMYGPSTFSLYLGISKAHFLYQFTVNAFLTCFTSTSLSDGSDITVSAFLKSI